MNKTVVPLEDIQKFLKEKYGIKENTIRRINSGEFSDAYQVQFRGDDFILRINSDTDKGFRKEKIVHESFPLIPTPEIVEIGTFPSSGYFALSRKLEGQQLVKLNTKETVCVLPDLYTVMNKIHNSLPPKNKIWKQKKWSEILDEYVTKDVEKISNIFFDTKLYDRLLKVFQTTIVDITDYNYFVHGDFGRTNIFAYGDKITGVIDWSEAMVGDFLWDLAWIAFWPKEIDFIDSYYKFNKNNKNLEMNNYQKRLMLYKLVIGINTMIFSGLRNDKETYEEAVSRVQEFIQI